MDSTVLFWVILGSILVFSELIVPGLIVIFLGMASFFVAFGIWMGWFVSLIDILTAWMLSSLVLIFSLRQVFARLAPGESVVSNMDEDKDAYGSIVEVLKTVGPHEKGRIFFRGTSWEASSSQVIKTGEKAILKSRDLNMWIIEPMDFKNINEEAE